MILLLLLYLIPSFLFDFVFPFWQGYLPYYFDLGFIVVALYLFRNKINLNLLPAARMGRSLLIYLIAGAITLLFARVFSTEIPFDLSSRGTILFLVLLGPILEELIFRFSLWNLISRVTGCEKAAFYGTTVLFSLAHFKAIFIINNAFVTFVAFQSLYTIILGRQLGERYGERKSIAEVILLHAFYNLGFWLASLVLY